MLLLEITQNAFREEVERLIAQDWNLDPLIPTSSAIANELDDDEYEEHQEFVDKVVQYAISHRITSPRQAIDDVIDTIRQGHAPTIH